MNAETVQALIESDNDQHAAAAREWVATSSWGDLMKFWMWLQDEQSDQYIEYATRLAAIALAPMLAEKFKNERPPQ